MRAHTHTHGQLTRPAHVAEDWGSVSHANGRCASKPKP